MLGDSRPGNEARKLSVLESNLLCAYVLDSRSSYMYVYTENRPL